MAATIFSALKITHRNGSDSSPRSVTTGFWGVTRTLMFMDGLAVNFPAGAGAGAGAGCCAEGIPLAALVSLPDSVGLARVVEVKGDV